MFTNPFPTLPRFLVGLLLGRGLNGRIIGQRYLAEVPKRGRLEKTDGIHSHQPTFQESKPPSSEDNRTKRILSVNEPHVVEYLLAHFHGFLQVGKLFVMS